MAKTTAHAVVLEILRRADGEWSGKTKLFKAFYFSHLYYAAERPGSLTDWPIARMPQGPGIHDSDVLFAELVGEGLLTVEHIHDGPYPEYRYRLTEKGKKTDPLTGVPGVAVERAARFCLTKTAAELSQLTHEHSRSWNEAKNGDLLDVEVDLIPGEEYARRSEEIRCNEQLLATVLGGGG